MCQEPLVTQRSEGRKCERVRLRCCVNRGQPFGCDDWVQRMDKRFLIPFLLHLFSPLTPFRSPDTFSLPLPPAQRWAANGHFLDLIIAKGDKVILTVARDKIKATSDLAKEVRYLIRKGYHWVDEFTLEKL